MGKTTTPKYRIEARDQTGAWTACWRGRANEAALAKYVAATNESMKPGGCNEHVSRAHGFMPCISSARVVEQRTSEVVATYAAPMFQVF